MYNQLTDIIKSLALFGHHAEAMKIIESLPNYQYKTYIYSELANYLYSHNNESSAFSYLDSAFVNQTKLDPDEEYDLLDPNMALINTLAGIGSMALNNKAKDMFIEMAPGFKDQALDSYISGIAYEGNYYHAVEAIPVNGSSNAEIQYYTNILSEEAKKIGNRVGWEKLAKNWNDTNRDYIIFRDQN